MNAAAPREGPSAEWPELAFPELPSSVSGTWFEGKEFTTDWSIGNSAFGRTSPRGLLAAGPPYWKSERPTEAIDWFVTNHAKDLDVFHRGYQIAGKRLSIGLIERSEINGFLRKAFRLGGFLDASRGHDPIRQRKLFAEIRQPHGGMNVAPLK